MRDLSLKANGHDFDERVKVWEVFPLWRVEVVTREVKDTGWSVSDKE